MENKHIQHQTSTEPSPEYNSQWTKNRDRKAQSIFISTRVVNLYANLGDVTYSRCTFNQIPNKDAYIWNSMLSSYVRSTHFHEAVNCLYKMLLKSEVRPDFYSFPPVLKACGNLFDGKKIHAGDGGSWNAMISGFCQNGKASEALGVLDEMRFEGMKMDCVTVSTILPACAQMDDILHGMLIHLYIIKHGLEFDVFMSNALINMYAKFGNIWQAQKVFNQKFVRDLVSWNSIIAAYEQNTHPDTALKFYGEMQSNGIQPDVLTLVNGQNGLASEAIEVHCTMEACEDVNSKPRDLGKRFTSLLSPRSLETGDENSMVYFKSQSSLGCLCWYLPHRSVWKMWEIRRRNDEFSSVECHNIVSVGFTGHGETSMQLFQAMQDEGVKPDHVTFVSLLSSCSHSGLVGQGQWCFRVMQDEYGIEPSLKYYGCTVDLLGRAGYLEKAYSFVKNMPLRPDASDVEEDEKEYILASHSERLAIISLLHPILSTTTTTIAIELKRIRIAISIWCYVSYPHHSSLLGFAAVQVFLLSV
ncbi:hypothetical protein HYC85_000286 [Camellia sinensis]|uniref:Pentatricopeptide repeat-containing protein n=1 Tax=Camellia sinensis TaxID=4442 RepID=A0A7J7I373_CAMSI|nr:hypothetical protein HYC85_000286 [Camellia sinensis]